MSTSNHMGNIALTRAMAHYAKDHYIFLPVADNGGDVDMIVSKDGVTLRRVQCKYTTWIASWTKTKKIPHYRVGLYKTCRNSEGKQHNYPLYTEGSFDVLWLSTPNGDYAIEWADICKDKAVAPTRLTINEDFEPYKV